MAKTWQVPSPRIILHPVWGWTSRLILGALLLVTITGAFLAGVHVTRDEAQNLAELAATLTRDNLLLEEQLDALRADKAALERTQRLDQDTMLAAQEGLKQEQEIRQALEKDLSALKRLIRQGGGGILRIQDFILTPTAEERLFAYSFTVRQLIPDYTESLAKVTIKLIGRRNHAPLELAVDPLPGSSPDGLKLKFKHFQQVEGKLKVPVDVEAEGVLIEIEPLSKMLIPTSESFPWPLQPEIRSDSTTEMEAASAG